MKKVLSIITFASGIVASSYSVAAGDITRQVQQGDSSNGSFVELGLIWQATDLPLIGFNGNREADESDQTIRDLAIDVHGRFSYKNFFVEAIQSSFNDIKLGYSVVNNERYSLDFVATQTFDSVRRNDLPGFETINSRTGEVNLGFRSSFYNGDNIFQYELVGDASGAHGGFAATLQYGRQYQIRNWNLHSLVGVRYFSERVLDHYFGVSEAESTDTIEAFDAGGGILPTVLLGATLPLNEKWLLRADAEYSYFPSSISDSPLAQGDDTYVVQGGIYRVFKPGGG